MNAHDSIADELKQAAPLLANHARTHPFLMPDQFFETMEKHLLDAMKNERPDQQPFSLAEKHHPFRVPENYFERLPDLVAKKVVENDGQDKPVHLKFRKGRLHYPSLLVAASAALLIAISFARWGYHTDAVTANEPTPGALLYAAELDDYTIVKAYLDNEGRQTTDSIESDESLLLQEATDLNLSYITGM